MSPSFLVCCLAGWILAGWAGPVDQPKRDPNLAAAMDYLKLNDIPNAIRALERAEQAAPRSSPEIYILLATAHLHLHERDAAFETCQKGLKLFPHSPPLARYYVSLALSQSEPVEQVARLEEALVISPQSPYIQMALGRVLAESDWHNLLAEGLLHAAARKLPRDPEARYRYASWLCSHEKSEQCVTEISVALALDPGNLVAQMQGYAYMGNAEDALGHVDSADRAFKRSLDLNARLGWPNVRVPTYYARFLTDQGRVKEAEQKLQEVLQRSPDNGPARRELARLYAVTGRMQEAVAEGRRALAYPQGEIADQRALRLILIKALVSLGQKAEAEEYEEWVREHPH